MRPSFRVFWYLLLGVWLLPLGVATQTLPLGVSGLTVAYRSAQLMGRAGPSLSFTSLPSISAQSMNVSDIYDPYGTLQTGRWTHRDSVKTFAGGKISFRLLPVSLLSKYSGRTPISLNDGSMIPAKGLQNIFSAGVYAKLGPLSIQFQPEYHYAQNLPFEGFPTEHSNAVWTSYYKLHNWIDLPDRFGYGPVEKFSWGQSSVRVNLGPASIGISNENLWWGPGMRNSLLMTNSAPGFKHLTLNNSRPIKTLVGSFEGQLIVGRLDSSGFKPSMLERDNLGNRLYKPKPNDWRYLNGIVLSYQPKWVPGLFLGASRAFYTYHKGLGNKLGSYLPVIIPIFKKSLTNVSDETSGRDQLASIFIRWLWPKEFSEIYVEFGREDHSADLRDLFLQPGHTRGYVFGLTKLYPVKRKPGQFVQINFEISQLEATNLRRTPLYFFWYSHYQITHGYTHQGQLLGAGIGPGSNMQTINISWINKLKVIGIQVERYAHNNDFHYLAAMNAQQRWTDMITSLFTKWDYKNLLLTCKIDNIIAINYQWLNEQVITQEGTLQKGKNTCTFQVLLGVMYRF